jgi:hypothetical protein
MVIFDCVPEAVPATEFTVISAGPPLPKVNVTPSSRLHYQAPPGHSD